MRASGSLDLRLNCGVLEIRFLLPSSTLCPSQTLGHERLHNFARNGSPERRVRHLAYWGDFIHELNSLGAPISAVGREPSRHNSMWFGVGRRGISLEGVTNTFEGWIRVQLTYSRGMASQFNLLKDRGKSFMEESLSKKTVWTIAMGGQEGLL